MDWITVANYAGEVIGVLTLIPLVLFWVTYQLRAAWKTERPGRALMYTVRGLTATIALLVLWTFWPAPREIRWLLEIVVYLPFSLAVWNLYLTLRKTLGLGPRFLFKVARKPQPGETIDEDTQPPIKEK